MNQMVTEERVANLETVLAQFIQQSNAVIAEIRASNAETDRQLREWREQADKDRQETHRRLLQQWQETDRRLLLQRQETDRQFRQWQKRADKERKDFNKQMAELFDSMGTLIEDMVAPCGFQLAKAIFRDQEAETCSIRLRRRHPAHRGEMMELDLLAIGATKVLVIEVKRRLDTGQIAEYREKVARLTDFFPELAGQTILAAVASVYLEPSVINYLNGQKVYGIAMGEEVMEVINLGQF